MKKIVPVVITVFVVTYLSAYLFLLSTGIQDDVPFQVKIFIIMIGLAIAGIMGGMIATLAIRLKELNKEDNDDLSKY